jgi:hypothetical protein
MVNGRWFFVIFLIQYHLILIKIHWSISFHFYPHIVCLSTCWKNLQVSCRYAIIDIIYIYYWTVPQSFPSLGITQS